MVEPFIDDLLSFGLPIHVVLDGAIVPDIEKHLQRHEITGRPLFRDTMDRETVIAGPWLSSPGLSHAALARSVAAARDAGQGVFWLGDQGEEAFFRHLRKMGAARMPDGRVLYFRYYDSDVLAAIIPMANPEQAAHLFGPADVIALIGGCGDGATVEKPMGLPKAASGPIAFEAWQIERLDERARENSRRKIAVILRKQLTAETSNLGDAEMHRLILMSEQDARSLGLTTESSFARWAYLELITGGGMRQNNFVRDTLVREKCSNVDEALDLHFGQLLVAGRRYQEIRKGSRDA